MPVRVGLGRVAAAIADFLALSATVRAQVVPIPIAVEPPSGSLNGGLDIKIAGAGFSAGVIGVFFAERPSPLVTVIDDKTLFAVLPPGNVPASPVDVIVTTQKDRLVLPLGFRYMNDPPVARASPGGKGYAIRSGDTLVLDGSGSRDPNGDAGDRIVLFEWDIDADGLPDRRGEVVTLTTAELGAILASSRTEPSPVQILEPVTALITLTVTDLHVATASDSAILTVLEEVASFPNDLYRNWVGDADGNRIDDAIDRRADAEKVDTIVLLAHGSDLDAAAARFAPYTDAPPVKIPAITALSLDGITAGSIRAVVAIDPDLFRAEEEVLIEADLSISGAAIRARPSLEHSPDTAHDRGILGAGVNIAFLDSGIDDDHPALAGKFVAGIDVFTDDASAPGSQSNPDDDFEFAGFFHGTHMAGIAVSTDPVYEGVAPAAKLIDVKVLDRLGRGSTSTMLLGLRTRAAGARSSSSRAMRRCARSARGNGS